MVNSGVFAQKATIESVVAKVDKGHLIVNWSSNQQANAYWQIQGSVDGKNYSTIGFVMGNDPAAQNNFKFKQPMAKLKPGLKYFRVLLMEDAENGIASNSIQLTK
ncbi:hypothetical protein EGI32_20875 [Ferruginibacter sp. HRS2-29]|nr:hypothetical protein [Ferruginibacter sp. HRS2-29]